MKDSKDFDCVEMKGRIQERLLSEFHDMSPEEARQVQRQRIADDPLLGPFLQKVAVSSPATVESHG